MKTIHRPAIAGVLSLGLATLLMAMAVGANAAPRISVNPNAQYGGHTRWVDGVGENGTQGLVLDNTGSPGAGYSFAAATVAGTNGLSTNGLVLAYDMYEPLHPGSGCQQSQFDTSLMVPSFNVEVIYPDGSHHAFWLSCADAIITSSTALRWTTYTFDTESLAGGSVRGMAIFFDTFDESVTLDNIRVNGTVVGGRGGADASH